MNQETKGHSYLENHLEICLKVLPLNHPELATSYFNIGLVHEKMCEYSKACSFYRHAADIAQRTLPSNHTDLEIYRKNLEGKELNQFQTVYED